MAVLFDDVNTQSLDTTSSPITATPWTMACWAKSDSISISGSAFSLADRSIGSQRFTMQMAGNEAGDPVKFFHNASLVTSTGITINTWHHYCGVAVADNAWAVYLDAGGKTTDSNNTPPSGLDTVSVGVIGDSSPSSFFSGDIAEVALWNAALSDAEVTILASSYSPLFVRPSSLVFYAPLVRLDAGDDAHDIIGGLTLVGSGGTGVPVTSPHPAIIMPSPAQMAYITAAAPPVVSGSPHGGGGGGPGAVYYP